MAEPPAPLATILVVEDEAGIRALVRKILRRQGYEVLEAANGQDALTLCREHGQRVELLITDVLMPQMGGRELVERLQTQGHDMKVLYVSGYTDDATVYSGDLPPGTAFLQKPFTLGSLLDKVKEVLAQVALTNKRTLLPRKSEQEVDRHWRCFERGRSPLSRRRIR